MKKYMLKSAGPMIWLFLALPAFTQKNLPSTWMSLFNGKDLTGWDIKVAGSKLNDNYKNTFRVQDGMIRIAYDQYKTFDGKYGHMYFRKPYSYYMLRFEYRFLGNQTPGGATWNVRNSGVMIHSQSARSLTINQEFPVSLEVQLLGGLNKGERHTGNLCTPGTQVHINGKLSQEHCTDSRSKTYNGDQWVHVTVVVLGDSVIKHIVEGDTVLVYQKPEIGGGWINKENDWKSGKVDNAQYWISKDGTPLKEGYIALQAESHPIDFRKIELLNLEGCTDPSAKNYKPYYVKSDNKQCKYK
jgi:hypothetical protein